jgi:hypothetical protein
MQPQTFSTQSANNRHARFRFANNVEAICLSVVIQLVQRNSHLSGKLNEENGESDQRHNKENGNANLMLNVQEGACKRDDYENSYRDTTDQGPQDCSVHHGRAPLYDKPK